jgi:transposase
MLMLPSTVRIYLAPGVTDMRRSFDGLAATVRRVLCQDPLSGHVFVFCNRRRTILKVLVWDRSGFTVLAKRLEHGTFCWPVPGPGEEQVEMRSEELAALLGGLDLSQTQRRRWFDRRPAEAG